MIRRPPRSTLDRSSAASDVYKRQLLISGSKVRVLDGPPIESGVSENIPERLMPSSANPDATEFSPHRIRTTALTESARCGTPVTSPEDESVPSWLTSERPLRHMS